MAVQNRGGTLPTAHEIAACVQPLRPVTVRMSPTERFRTALDRSTTSLDAQLLLPDRLARSSVAVLPLVAAGLSMTLLPDRRLAQPLTRQEHAAAALLSQARHDTRIRGALEEAVVLPLAGAVTTLIAHHTGRGHVIAPTPQRLVGIMVQALWWDRYLTRQPITTAPDTDHVVDQALMPLLG